jgi:glyoxylase-like metal-dependent hydrolase (beta-lactamase superfamily II)
MPGATRIDLGEASRPKIFPRSCPPAMVRKVFSGRATFHDGEDEIVPGVTVHHIGGHSTGLQSVRVKTRRSHVVLAADATHLYAHIDSGRVFPIVYNVAEVIEGHGTLKKLATSPRHVMPGHDPPVLARYPAAKPGLEGWIARLDAVPNDR